MQRKRLTDPPLSIAPLIVSILAACGVWGSTVPRDAQQFEPPAVYQRWWRETEACSGAVGDLRAVRWYTVPNVASLRVRGADALGFWSDRTNAIVLADSQVGNGSVVRHEMLHALLGFHGHPHSQFAGRCYGWVNCGACAADQADGMPPVPAPAPIPEDSLQLDVRVVPDSPSAAVDGGFFSVIVTARNPSPAWRVVPLGLQRRRPPATFGLDLTGPSGGTIQGELAHDYADSTFAPSESKRFVYDFQLGRSVSANRPPAGEYQARGRYGTRWSDPVAFTLLP